MSEVGPVAEEAVWPVTMLFLGAGECLEKAKGGEHRRSWSVNSCYGICCDGLCVGREGVRPSGSGTETVRATDELKESVCDQSVVSAEYVRGARMRERFSVDSGSREDGSIERTESPKEVSEGEVLQDV